MIETIKHNINLISTFCFTLTGIYMAINEIDRWELFLISALVSLGHFNNQNKN